MRARCFMQSRGIPRARAQAHLTPAASRNDALERIGRAVRAAFEADADAWLGSTL
ncbi:hypothetical protein AB5I41_16665 [Sphingomonas sp. MMS24-JH45]